MAKKVSQVQQHPKNILSRLQQHPSLGHYALIILGMVRKNHHPYQRDLVSLIRTRVDLQKIFFFFSRRFTDILKGIFGYMLYISSFFSWFSSFTFFAIFQIRIFCNFWNNFYSFRVFTPFEPFDFFSLFGFQL